VAAVRGGHSPPVDGGEEFNENDWTDLDDPTITPYTRSKTIAEQDAWVLVDDAGARDRLAVINPGAIIGPLLSDDASFSLQLIERLLTGMPAIPQLGYSFVDVRDVADAHVRAMEQEAAGGGRFITVDRFMWMTEVAAILKDRLGDRARKVTTRQAPDLLIRAIGIFDPAVRTIVGDLGQKPLLSNERVRGTLGWSPRPIEDSIAETAESMFAQGIVKG
jgi:nucleoside-diphosphate-sugar epimerase